MTHKHVTALLAGYMPRGESRHTKFKFYQKCANSKSLVVKGMTHMSLFNHISTNANSYVDIINKYYMFSGLNCNAIHLKWNNNNNVTNEGNGNIDVLYDIFKIRDSF